MSTCSICQAYISGPCYLVPLLTYTGHPCTLPFTASGMNELPPSGSSLLDPSRTGAQAILDQEHIETQRSLHEASTALETAYNRIRRVQSLLQLSDSSPNADTQRRFDHDLDAIGPGHEALVLLANQSDNGMDFEDSVDAGFSSLSIERPDTLSNFELRRRNGRPSRATSPANANQPVFPSGSYPGTAQNMSFRPTDGLNESRFSQRYGTNEDSASTTRGLRVAAREANARTSDQMDRNIEFLRGPTHERLPRHLEGSGLPNEPHSRLSRNPEFRRTAPLSPILTAISPPSALWRALETRRWRNLRQDARQTARPMSYDRLDAYPSFSNVVNNDFMSQPSSTTTSHTLLLADQRNRRFPTASEHFRLYQEALIDDHPLVQRNHRFGDTPGNFNADWDADFVPWFLPTPRPDLPQQYRDPLPLPSRYNRQQRDDTTRVTRTTNTTISPSEDSLPRRGWARLDPDGNEIPPSEEEELERSRTEYRIRALHRAREHAANRSDDGIEHHSRIYQPTGAQRVAYGSVMDATLNIQDRRRHQLDMAHRDDQVPFYVDPLPMPLSSMVMKPEKTEQNEPCADIVVPRHACLAGR